MLKRLILALISVLVVVCGAIAVPWYYAYKPQAVEPADLNCSANTAKWPADKPLRVMTFNVQYMASKNYVFFYDYQEGPDKRPSKEHVLETLDKVADLIIEENPDVVLLQEMTDETDSRTYYMDQTEELLSRLPKRKYPCQAQASYWKAPYVPHSKIMGSVGMKLVTLSKYKMEYATRYQLPLMEKDPVSQAFYFKRAVLETPILANDDTKVVLLNTHFDAWAEGTGLIDKQLQKTESIIQNLEDQELEWIIGGDFNALPPDGGKQLEAIRYSGIGDYDDESPLTHWYAKYGAIPSIEELQQDDPSRWYTYFPNDTRAEGPDRTIDYFFYSRQLLVADQYVRQDEALTISDHMPVVAVFERPQPEDQEGEVEGDEETEDTDSIESNLDEINEEAL